MTALVAAFQTAEGLTVSGSIDGYTWNKLLTFTPVSVKWVKTGTTLTAQLRRR